MKAAETDELSIKNCRRSEANGYSHVLVFVHVSAVVLVLEIRWRFSPLLLRVR